MLTSPYKSFSAAVSCSFSKKSDRLLSTCGKLYRQVLAGWKWGFGSGSGLCSSVPVRNLLCFGAGDRVSFSGDGIGEDLRNRFRLWCLISLELVVTSGRKQLAVNN